MSDPVTPAAGSIPLHVRNYDVEASCIAPDRLLVRGRVRDTKPPGAFLRGDPLPLVMHDMVVELVVSYPELVIVSAEVGMETHPHPECRGIIEAYRSLVGVEVGRGFTRIVRERFGGPRGCTHTTALLLAMGPVVVQALYSMHAIAGHDDDAAGDPTERHREVNRRNLDTCHVWAQGTPFVETALADPVSQTPLTIARRIEELDLDPGVWRF